MNPIIIGSALAVGARFVSKHVKLPVTTINIVENTLDAIEDITAIVGNIDPNRPDTWIQFGSRLIGRALSNDHAATTANRWLEVQGYTFSEERLPMIWQEVVKRATATAAYRDPRDCIWKLAFGGQHIYLAGHPGEDPQQLKLLGRRGREFRLPADPAARQLVFDAMAQIFWASRTSITLDAPEYELRLAQTERSATPYFGPKTLYFEKWRSYRAAGLRRSVLLQGAPGCGKSTFAMAAAKALTTRTIFLTHEAVSQLNAADWQFALIALQPEMLVIDDIEGVRDLGERLAMFEEEHCDVPYIIFTTNLLTRLPLALRRPGRIDQILRFDNPSDEVLLRLIEDLANKAGVKVDPARIPEFKRVVTELSPAHLLEIFRRAAVQGWDAKPWSTDITFGASHCQERDG